METFLKNMPMFKLCVLVGGFNPFQKQISQNGNLPQIGVKLKNIWNHHPVCQGSFRSLTFSSFMGDGGPASFHGKLPLKKRSSREPTFDLVACWLPTSQEGLVSYGLSWLILVNSGSFWLVLVSLGWLWLYLCFILVSYDYVVVRWVGVCFC